MTDAPSPQPDRPPPDRPEVRRRGWLEVRWRQARNAPQPIVRAVTADLAVAVVAGIGLLAYDVALGHGIRLPGGDLRVLAFALFVVVVCVVGSVLTYLWVPLPGPGGGRGRTAWAGLLGLFAAFPIAYLVLVVAFQVIRPFLGP